VVWQPPVYEGWKPTWPGHSEQDEVGIGGLCMVLTWKITHGHRIHPDQEHGHDTCSSLTLLFLSDDNTEKRTPSPVHAVCQPWL
jgi:hypothetical protein